MPDLTSISTLLPTYPFWVRAVMFGIALIWLVVYAVMMFMAPKPPPATLTMASIQQAFSEKWPDSLVFDMTLLNNTGATLATTKIEIIYFKDEVTWSGLASSDSVLSVYTIAKDENGLVVGSGNGFVNRVTARLDKPFGNSRQMEVSIPINEVINSKRGTRLMIMLHDAQPVDASVNRAQITLYYNNDRTLVATTDIVVPGGRRGSEASAPSPVPTLP